MNMLFLVPGKVLATRLVPPALIKAVRDGEKARVSL